MHNGKRKRRTRRSFSEEFKAETVKLVRGSEKSIGMIARELDLTETALRAWVRQAVYSVWRGLLKRFSGVGPDVR
jgi:transposase